MIWKNGKKSKKRPDKQQEKRERKISQQQKKLLTTELEQFVEEAAEQDDLLAGQLIYEQLYGQKDLHIKRLWRAIYILSGALILSIVAIAMLGSESKVDPVIVKVDGNNQILDVQQAAHLNYNLIEPYMATYMLEQFIKNVRGISIDGQYESDRLKSAYAMTQGAATKTVEAFITGRDPYSTASTEVITVQIDNVMPNVGGSAHTTQIEWTEIARDPKNDQVLSEKTYTAQLSFQWNKPAKEVSVINYNPLGFYITQIAWSENVESN